MKKKTRKVDLLFQTFVGEPISILLDQYREQVEQTDSHIKTIKEPISAQGYLVDMDDDFLFLGYEPTVIAQAIRRERIVQIDIIEVSIEDMINQSVEVDKGYN